MSNKLKKDNNSFEEVIKGSSKKKNIIFDFSKTWIAYLVFAILVILSFLIKNVINKSEDSELKSEFGKSYSSVITRFNNHYERLEQIIQSTQGLYYENVEVVRDYFELNGAVPVKTYNSIICMTYAPKVMNSQWADFQHSAISQGYNSYNLKPAGEREYYYPVVHIVDYETNMNRLAFDYASSPILKAAIELARDEDIITSTEIFDLRNNSPSFALIAPVFKRETNKSDIDNRRKNFKGSVVIEVDAIKYFTNAIKGTDSEHNKNTFASDTSIIFAVIDTNSKGEEYTIFESDNFQNFELNNYEPMFSCVIPITIANRTLNVKFFTVPNFDSSINLKLPLIIFIASLLISFIAFLLIITLLTRKAIAEEIAEKMIASQKRILDTSTDIIAVVGSDGKWLSMNNASNILLGIEPNKMVGTKVVGYFFDKKDEAIWNEIIENRKENTRIDIKIKSNNGVDAKIDEFVWISWDFACPSNENLIYAIGRNITLEKKASEEIKSKAKLIELSQYYEEEVLTSKTLMMIRLSHELRNQLTSVMGYLQLIINKIYDSEEELLLYANNANESSEHAFEFIQSASEATIGDSDTFSKMAVHTVEDTIMTVLNDFQNSNTNIKINLKFAKNEKNSHIVVDISILNEVWANLFAIFSAGPNNEYDMILVANENKMEAVTEIVLEVPIYDELLRLVEIYNANTVNVIERLSEDYNDILLNIAKTASLVKRMMGTFSINMINDNNIYVLISLPLVSRIKNE